MSRASFVAVFKIFDTESGIVGDSKIVFCGSDPDWGDAIFGIVNPVKGDDVWFEVVGAADATGDEEEEITGFVSS